MRSLISGMVHSMIVLSFKLLVLVSASSAEVPRFFVITSPHSLIRIKCGVHREWYWFVSTCFGQSLGEEIEIRDKEEEDKCLELNLLNVQKFSFSINDKSY